MQAEVDLVYEEAGHSLQPRLPNAADVLDSDLDVILVSVHRQGALRADLITLHSSRGYAANAGAKMLEFRPR